MRIKTESEVQTASRPEDEELNTIRSLLGENATSEAIDGLQRLILHRPLDPAPFAVLGEAYKICGKIGHSVVALERALQLKELLAQSEPSAGASRLADLEDSVINTGNPLRVDDHVFPRLRLMRNGNGVIMVGRSLDGTSFIKIEIAANPLKSRKLPEEAEIVRSLSDAGCITSPHFHCQGELTASDIVESLDGEARPTIEAAKSNAFPFYIQEYMRSDRGYHLADIALAMMEQKALGVFHGDIRPDNIRFDAERGLCRFIDFDQAEFLDDATRELPNRAYFEWCAERARQKYAKWKHKDFLAYFQGIDLRHFLSLFRKDALSLAYTSVFKKQIATATRTFYHTIDTPQVFVKGERDLGHRRALLDGIDFTEGETVLDVGCSSGLLSTYLAQRGCRVTGVEIDAKLLNGTRILANVMGLPIRYFALDLDNAQVPGEFETICLFSVIHHTKRLAENGRKIAEAARHRILIECRLKEYGLKWGGKRFEKSSAWDYPDLDSMTLGLEDLFPGFRFHLNHGQGDRDRFILEFLKTA